jgi:hypothetical protein
MRKFITKVLIYIFPFILILILVITWDPFKIIFTYNDYYTGNMIQGNREDICLKLFNRRTDKNKINSFIIGNSRSHAFKTNNWVKFLNKSPKNPNCFHFDGSGLGLYRANNIIKYLDNNVENIANVLIVLDHDFFTEISNPKEHLIIEPPAISKESKFTYYTTFISASLDFRFLICNLFYNISGKYYPFMGDYISKSKHSHISNNYTGDIFYGSDQDIRNDSVNYYNKLIAQGAFSKEDQKNKKNMSYIGTEQIKLLKQMMDTFSKNKTNYKIIVSPLFNQIPFNKQDLSALLEIFGNDHVFDFSGVNDITNNLYNYYENSHYKPYIANEIMSLCYNFSCK